MGIRPQATRSMERHPLAWRGPEKAVVAGPAPSLIVFDMPATGALADLDAQLDPTA